MEKEREENVPSNVAITGDTSDSDISDQELLELSRGEMNKLVKGRSDGDDLRKRRKALKRKLSSIRTRSEQKEAMKLKRRLDEKTERTAALKPRDRIKVSVKHREKFERLLELWENDPKSITIVNDNGVCFKEEFVIGRGSYGTEVYVCLGSDGIERAIKRLPKHLCKKFLKNERDILNSPNAVDSPRIVNYCFYDETSNPDFGYLILNLYEQNLEEYISEEGETITESRARKMIRQVLLGLKALHAREPRILHRDLKPTNILVDKSGNLLLSDFGIGRFFPEQGATTYHTSNESGSQGWVAHECIDWNGLCSDNPSDTPIQLRWKEKSDIQVAGMLSFYILTKGKHPFGPKISQMMNLHKDNPVGLRELDDPVVKDLLSRMLAQELDKRPYVEQALKHPYFLSLEEQMKLVEAVGNEPQLTSYNGVYRQLNNLDPSKPRSLLLPKDWKTVIGHDDLYTLCRGGYRLPSAHDGSQYTDCLRLIRNTFQHRHGKLRQLKKKAPATSSVEEYFFQLFPKLPFVLHEIIREYPNWKMLPALKEFFPVINRCVVSDVE
ncbi:serine threonine- kinase endoribonuclease IRE1 [Paramuricea clavata]|uniref:Serine threonine- kinase endoribonuclease IRE1 n=1 Tax=Paramuricea clavata TaxID=317549 RepID=A0A6S7IXW2_PARCT|nr:serine threonine- kinase endoribonuclease IRE1 [Paramuricea clavata]